MSGHDEDRKATDAAEQTPFEAIEASGLPDEETFVVHRFHKIIVGP